LGDTFQLLRLSLTPRDRRQQEFEFGVAATEPPTREAFLRDVFSRSIEFTHYGNTFHYAPAPPAAGENVILGRVGLTCLGFFGPAEA
jgi:hypothetical protein